MEKASIRVSKGIEVEVNDNGDTITMNVESAEFVNEFYALLDKFENLADKARSDEYKAMDTREKLTVIVQGTKDVLASIDSIFGDGASRKIFGDATPSLYIIADYFEKITPIIRKYAEQRRSDIMRRYNSSRMAGAAGMRGH